MGITIPAIKNWRRIFIDTSFIIDSVRTLPINPEKDPKYWNIKNTHDLIDYFKLRSTKETTSVRWVTSSIVLSELTKFEDSDAVEALQDLFDTPEVEIINFTKKEAEFILNDMVDYIEQDHVNQFFKDLKDALSSQNVFNPRNYIAKDALIIACAKSKGCDVVLTSDKNSFIPIARQVKLPVLDTKDLPRGVFEDLDYDSPITTDY